jgi:hypothetical protein
MRNLADFIVRRQVMAPSTIHRQNLDKVLMGEQGGLFRR